MEVRRLYLDLSALNRPFDDQDQSRVELESRAVLIILRMVATRDVELVTSEVIRAENDASPFPDRKWWISRFMSLAGIDQEVDGSVSARAKELEAAGMKPLDALHIAAAEEAGASHFIACDDRLLRRYRGPIRAVNPVDFIRLHTELGRSKW